MADEFIPELTLNPNSPLAGQGQAAAAPAPAARAAVPRVRADISAVPAAADAPRVRAAEARPARLRPASGSPRRPPEATT